MRTDAPLDKITSVDCPEADHLFRVDGDEDAADAGGGGRGVEGSGVQDNRVVKDQGEGLGVWSDGGVGARGAGGSQKEEGGGAFRVEGEVKKSVVSGGLFKRRMADSTS